MQLPSPIATVASAVHHAALVALPDIHYRKRDLTAMRGWAADKRIAAMRDETVPMKDAVRRPDASECEIFAMFPQTWGSTALGYGGLGGAAMTPAYTVVVQGPEGHLAVYWNTSLAYILDPGKQSEAHRRAFQEDLAKRWTVGVMEAVVRYGAIPARADV